MADASADQLGTELKAALAANTGRLLDALGVELARAIVLEPGQRIQFEVDPFFYGITSCRSEETVLAGNWLDGSLPPDWYERAEQALGAWDGLVSQELCSWFADCWREAGGPDRHSPAFLFFHGYHNNQYDLEGRRWLSGKELDDVWSGPNA